MHASFARTTRLGLHHGYPVRMVKTKRLRGIMKRTSKRIFNLKVVLCILVGVLLALSLLPLLYIAQYDLPIDDDLQAYQDGTAQTWEETHSVSAVVRTAYDKTVDYYNNWQGTYFASFLMNMLPSVFPLTLYAWTPAIMLLALIISTLFISRVLIVRCFHLSRVDWLLVSLTALLFQIQIMPSIKEGIFWLSSACLYLLSYCNLLLMFGFLLIARTATSRAARIFSIAMAMVLAFALAGGAFLLMTPSILLTALLLYQDIANRDKRKIVHTSLLLLVLVLGTILSTTAPGNQVRMEYSQTHYGTHGLSLVMATLQSIQAGVIFVAKYSGFAMLLFSGVCAAAFYEAAKRTSVRFHSPILVFVVTAALFCMQFYPTYYSMATAGPARQENIIYFTLYWYYVFNVLNFEGWLTQKYKVDVYFSQMRDALAKHNASLIHFGRKALFLTIVILTFFAFAQRESGLHANNSVLAISEIHNGVAADHYQQGLTRLQSGLVTEETADSQILP